MSDAAATCPRPHPHLPADLADALDATSALATDAVSLVICGQLDLGEARYQTILDRLRKSAHRRDIINSLLGELVPASNPTALFGASCAHRAAVLFFEAVWIEACAVSTNYDRWRVHVCTVNMDRPNLIALHAACEREAYVAADARGLAVPALPSQPENPFTRLLAVAHALHLKGNELTVITTLCERNGCVPLADLAHLCQWEPPFDGAWNSTCNRLNKKLKKAGWRLARDNNHAVIHKKSGARK